MGRVHDADRRLTAKLRERGYRVTPQRLVTYRVLCQLDGHVTGEELLAAANAQLPSVALATIYTILALLVDLGLVRRIATGGGTAIYDAAVEPHHHLVCTSCGAIGDLPIELDLAPAWTAADAAGFDADSVDVVVHGRCQTCQRAHRRTAGR
jgi:Fe2+ or Zn2+ uptake regulation protein